MDDLMPIGEFSQRSGLSPKRLRSYAAAGLLVPAAVDPSTGYRYYSPGQLRDAQLVDALRGAGVPLAEIAPVLRDPSSERLDEMSRRVDTDSERRRQALDTARALLVLDAHAIETTKGGAMRLHTFARTDAGRVRDTNEDAVLCTSRIAAVADGMGGHPGGDVASALAVALVDAAFSGRSRDELEAAVRAANRAVFERARADEHLEGMGTTLCAVGLVDDDELAIVNVGDSRAYRWRDGALERLTDDHTITAALVRRGDLSETEAGDHPRHGVLTRAVGVGPTVELDTVVAPARRGDRVLVCSDGLVNEVTDGEIAALLAGDDREWVSEALVARALEHGGRDNVTVVVVDVV